MEYINISLTIDCLVEKVEGVLSLPTIPVSGDVISFRHIDNPELHEKLVNPQKRKDETLHLRVTNRELTPGGIFVDCKPISPDEYDRK